MESNESSNMAGSDSPIDIVQSLMRDQGYLHEAFESSYETMDFLNQPDVAVAAAAAAAKDSDSSQTYAPEEFLNEPVASRGVNKNSDSSQSEFERLLNEDVVADAEDIVVGLSNEAVTFLSKTTEEFGIVSKPITDKTVKKTEKTIDKDASRDLNMSVDNISKKDSSKDLNLTLHDASKKDASKELNLIVDNASKKDASKDSNLIVDDETKKDVSKDSNLIVDNESKKVASKDLHLIVDNASKIDACKDTNLIVDDASKKDSSKDSNLIVDDASKASVKVNKKLVGDNLDSSSDSTKEDSAQTTKEKSESDSKAKKIDKGASVGKIRIANVVSQSSITKSQPESVEQESEKTNYTSNDETKDISSKSNIAENVTTESLEAMLESLDGPAEPQVTESEGSSNSIIAASNTFITEYSQDLMEENRTSEQDSNPINASAKSPGADDANCITEIEIKVEVDSEEEISYTDTFCESGQDHEADSYYFKMYECKAVTIDIHDIIKTESSRDAKAGLYKPSERKCIDTVRKEYKTKEMQAYLRRVKRMRLPEEIVTRHSALIASRPVKKTVKNTSQSLPKNPHITAKPMVLLAKPQVQRNKKPSLQSSNKVLSNRTSRSAGVKSPVKAKAMLNIIQSSRKRKYNEIQTPKSKKTKLSTETNKNSRQNKNQMHSKKKDKNKHISFETATKELTIELKDIMKMSKTREPIILKKGSKQANSKYDFANKRRVAVPVKPSKNLNEIVKNQRKIQETVKNQRKILPLHKKRDAEGRFKPKKAIRNDYSDDTYDDDDDDEDYQPSGIAANYTCFDCMEDFETNAELKVHRRMEHNESTKNTPRKSSVKPAPKKKRDTIPDYFKSNQSRIDGISGKRFIIQCQNKSLNKDDMIKGANMVNHHNTFYNHELGKNVTDQEMYQHMMKKYTIKAAQVCIGGKRFSSYYQTAKSPAEQYRNKISAITEDRGQVLITSPLIHW